MPNDERLANAPWTPEQVQRLNEWQGCRHVHPFTCGSGNRSDRAHRDCANRRGFTNNGVLVAIETGWICPAAGCGYRQSWAHPHMLNGAPPDPFQLLTRSQNGEPNGSTLKPLSTEKGMVE